MNIAVAIVHGMGRQKIDFHVEMEKELKARMATLNPNVRLSVEGIYWGDITDTIENRLWERTHADRLNWEKFFELRSFVVNYLGDAIAYQAVPRENDPCPNDYIYGDIHERYAKCLLRLSESSGENAPLCVISHSLGSIISSNFFYDLQHNKLTKKAANVIRGSSSRLARGETLTHLYTMGSPIALWTMRFEDFGIPISVPAPRLRELNIGEWVNFYDKDDLFAYPIKNLNELYNNIVTEDIEVKNPGILSWTPMSHTMYFESDEVLNRIVESLSIMTNKISSLPEVAVADE